MSPALRRLGQSLKRLRYAFSPDSWRPLRLNSSARRWLETSDLDIFQRLTRFTSVHGITTTVSPPPGRLRPSDPMLFGWGLTWRNEPTCVLRLPGGRYLEDEATVVSHDGTILADLCLLHPFTRRDDSHPLLRRRLFPPRQHFAGKGLLLASRFAHQNYYHWLFDVMPRLELFRLAGGDLAELDHVFVSNFTSAFQQEWMRYAGVPADKVVSVQGRASITCDELIVPSLPNRVGFPLAWMCAYLDSLVPDDGGEGPERIFIDRSDANIRRVANMGEFRAWLEARGVTCLTLSGRGVVEQARLFRRARCVLSTHGAGLSNLAFCRPGTRVFEWFPAGKDNNIFWFLSCHRGLDYSYLMAPPERTVGALDVVFCPEKDGPYLEAWLGL